LKISREIKTAILVIASILLFIWGYSFLKGRDLLNNYKTFYVVYDNVEGLAASAPVTISGLVVGKITSITLRESDAKLLVELQLKNDFPISKTSVVNIYEPGLIGGKQIQIIPNLEDKNLAESGDTLTGRIVPGLTALVGEKLTPLQDKVERTIVSADSLLNNMNKVLDARTRANLRSSIANLNATLAEFSEASKNVNGMLAENRSKIDRTMTSIDHASANFSKVSDTIAKANIGKTIRSLENTLAKVNNIVAQMESGKGTLGKLMKDEALYNNLTKSSRELELLLQDLRLHPTRYINISVFGKKNKPYVAPKASDTIAK
jgi:phospholipid/cholesterol/gamma-HCH transport system substrate-binding protein